jgi:transposase
VPAIQSDFIDFIWEQFRALLPERKVDHPLDCHRLRIPDYLVFEKLLQILVFGCAYWRIADESCSATTLSRRRDEWIEAGVMDALEQIAREAYDRIIGLELFDVAIDCCITKAPCGGQKAEARWIAGRGTGGLKRSTMVDAEGIPLGVVAAPANRQDSPLLGETLDASSKASTELPEHASVHLDRAYDSDLTRELLKDRGLVGVISEKGKPAPLRATKRWVVERTNSWSNAHKKLAWCTEREGRVIDFWIAFSNAIIIMGRLIREAWRNNRWEGRPDRRP